MHRIAFCGFTLGYRTSNIQNIRAYFLLFLGPPVNGRCVAWLAIARPFTAAA